MKVGGYQGARSILTEALGVFCSHAESSGLFRAELIPDVTVDGMTARSLFDAVESGAFDVCYLASGYLAARVSELAILDVPFHVGDRAKALASLDAEAGSILGAAVAAGTNLHVLAYWDNGFRHISNGIRPIHAPSDCSGLTIRTLDSPHYVAALSAMGFVPKVIDVAQFSAAIASGRVDAQENPLTNMLNFGVEQHHRHLSLTSHFFGAALLVCNKAWAARLSVVQKQVLDAAARASTLVERQLAAAEDSKALAQLESAGCKIIYPAEIDRNSFERAVQTGRQALLATVPATLRAVYSDV